MKLAHSILAATAAALMGTAGATAADLNGGHRGGMKDMGYAPAQVYSPMGLYLRGDATWSSMSVGEIYDPRANSLFNTSIDSAWAGGFGVGYYFSRHVRGDVTFDWRQQADVQGTTTDNAVLSTSVKSAVTLFNVYYDFDVRSHFTPYIGVGVGFARNTTGAGSLTSCACTVEFGGATEWSAAGALMAGVSAKLRDRLSLDAGYRFLYTGEAHTAAFDVGSGAAASTKLADLSAHEFRVGVRWDIK